MKKNLLIIGNGPSTKSLIGRFAELDKNFDTFGLSLAFRYYSKINWWPTYYSLADSKVLLAQKNEIENNLKNSPLSKDKIFFSYKLPNLEHEVIPHSQTGTFAIKKGIELGYKNIFLIGIEASYKEKISESKPLPFYKYITLGMFRLNIPLEKKN